MSEQKAKLGTKISPEAAKTMDRSKMAVGVSDTPEVEGQESYFAIIECPWCHSQLRAVLDTDVYVWVTCGRCGGAFTK